ncbi:CHAP domain-containing protein [Nonomuraea aurantiaca]|uniref:CHAP domain-containing protein n=1 Tax=Nonomuraea aurantiaca TaxID=2878562 RepID=UPI001CDA515B|nr:CHAP domain-containing protein [Nonomuraea aurantiaca]MCA2227241.1 CHAP domain-containing protein [Nonomuraea aurantiaca]
MTPEMKKYIDLLESQLGYSEKADAYTKFGHWYGKNVEFDADYTSAPWCDMYLSWAAHKLGYQDWIGQFAWTVGHAEWFKEQGAWGHKPKPGALVFYDWSGSNDIDAIDHVGLVTKVEGDKIFTIEGNIDGGVAKRKERDTSKVVGYGYPEKIKTRLENEAAKNQVEGEWDAQHRADDQASTSTTDVGQLQLPDGTPLVDMIPRIGQGEAPLVARPKQATGADTPQQAAAPAPTATRKSAPAATTKAAEQAPKKGKHAKPATADTNAVTSNPAPLPTVVDASSSAPVPALSSPALIGSTLVAALAVLAVAKTRQLRVRPARVAAVTAPAARSTGPATRHRHRRKTRAGAAPVLVGAGTSTDVTIPVRTPLELVGSTASAELSMPAAVHLEPAELLVPTAVRSEPVELLVPAAVHLEPTEPIAALLSLASIPIPEATTTFDAFSPVREATATFDAFTPSTRRAATPHHPASRSAQHPGGRSSTTARRVSAASQHPGGRTPYTRATEPWPAPGEPHSPQTGGGYYGRRRRSGHPIEEPAPFTSEGPLRGRRHRSAAPHPTEGFAQDSSPHGRRHRAPLAAPSHLELFGTEPFDATLHGRRHRNHESLAPTSLAVGGDDEHAANDFLRAARRTGDDRLQTAAHAQGVTVVEAREPRKPGSRRGRHRA